MSAKQALQRIDLRHLARVLGCLLRASAVPLYRITRVADRAQLQLNHAFSASLTGAFTLVEMLVSVAVLVLIMTFVSQMMNSTTISTSLSDKHGDADGQARLVFDRMAEDFGGMPHRTDVDFIFSKQPDPSALTASGSSDKMFFYSEAPGFYDTTVFSGTSAPLKAPVTLTGYSIYTTGTNPLFPSFSLLRLSKGLSWDSSPASNPGGMVFLTSPSPGATPIPASSMAGNWSGAIGSAPTYSGTETSNCDVLSSEVLRMEFCFQVKDLTNSSSPGSAFSNYPVAHFGSGAANKSTPSTIQPGSPTVGDRWYDTANNRAYICTSGSTSVAWSPIGMSDVNAVIVAIAVLDSNTRKIIPNQLVNISNALADPTEAQLSGSTPQLMDDTWSAAINANSPTFASTAGIPSTAAAQIRVYQRFFYLNNF